MKVKLGQVAHARSGDKGAASNVGVVANSPELYAWLSETLTVERVAAHFAAVARGKIVRYEVPNLSALNFILGDSLGGGGTESLKTDAQGKTHGQGLLELEVELPESLSRFARPAHSP